MARLTPPVCKGAHLVLNIRRLGIPEHLSQTEISRLWDYDVIDYEVAHHVNP